MITSALHAYGASLDHAHVILRFPPEGYKRHQERQLPQDQGFVSFVRLVRKSGRITLGARDRFMVDPELAYQYVLARVDLAEKIVVVMDNLNTHTPASFYETYAPEEARRLTERFEFHYTPKHGSWLNMAEIELSALTRQCLDRRIADQDTLTQEVQAWQARRNSEVVKVHWQFTTADARIKLRHLYPKIQS